MTTSDTTSGTTRPTGKAFTENGNGKTSDPLSSSATHPGEELTSTAKAEFEDIMSDLQELVRRASKVSGRELAILRQQMSHQLDVAREKLHEVSGDVSAAAHKGVASTEQMIKENPLPAIGIAAVAGIALGLLLNRH
jgi:ElaB/YqjD/DUF883 family membrane-anchored ribosome-binding protein